MSRTPERGQLAKKVQLLRTPPSAAPSFFLKGSPFGSPDARRSPGLVDSPAVRGSPGLPASANGSAVLLPTTPALDSPARAPSLYGSTLLARRSSSTLGGQSKRRLLFGTLPKEHDDPFWKPHAQVAESETERKRRKVAPEDLQSCPLKETLAKRKLSDQDLVDVAQRLSKSQPERFLCRNTPPILQKISREKEARSGLFSDLFAFVDEIFSSKVTETTREERTPSGAEGGIAKTEQSLTCRNITCKSPEQVCAGLKETNRVVSGQGEVWLGCPKRDLVWKRSTLKAAARLHRAGDEPHDLILFENQCKIYTELMLEFPDKSDQGDELATQDAIVRTTSAHLVALADNDSRNCWYCVEKDKEIEREQKQGAGESKEERRDATEERERRAVEDVALEMVQKRVNGLSLRDWLATKTHADAETHLEILGVLLQVLGCVWALWSVPQQHGAPPFFHNDLHNENIYITENLTQPVLVYNVAGLTYTLVNQNHLVKLIDYGTMTRGYPLDTRYRPPGLDKESGAAAFYAASSSSSSSVYPRPLIDICHVLTGFVAGSSSFGAFLENGSFPNLVCLLFFGGGLDPGKSTGVGRREHLALKGSAASDPLKTDASVRLMIADFLRISSQLNQVVSALQKSEEAEDEDDLF